MKSKEKELPVFGSLNERAQRVVHSSEYQKKVNDIKKGKHKFKIMEFYMNNVMLSMPYNGQKQTCGYLKKET